MISDFLSGYAYLNEKISLSRHFGGIFGGKTLTARLVGRIPTL
jgi:hypothetical protein